MANTYTQIYIHSVFVVKGRQSLIRKEWKNELHKYITGIIQNRGHKLLAINSMPDHMHILIGLKPEQSISDLTRDVKAISSKFINEKKFVPGKFSWQEGFGAFSHSRSQMDKVVRYILDQEKHHAKKNFLEEYKTLLEKFGVEYDVKYLFQPVG